MSTQCNRFVQNAWKKELCSNCFKSREEHTVTDETLRLNVERISTNLKIDNLQLQSILRGKTTICRKEDQQKKNVGFPTSLTEIIGYGGDDFFSDGEDEETQLDSSINPEDETPDSEEERALSNLTRANTNFNTITANLNAANAVSNDTIKSSSTTTTTTTTATTPSSRSFASLMLGRIQRDADGRKTTLLVSITPFGGDESIPTAKRPVDRKFNASLQSSPFRCKSDDGVISDNAIETTKKLNEERKKIDEHEQKYSTELQKIVDMPLITSTNMISVIRREGTTTTTTTTTANCNADTDKTTSGTTQSSTKVCLTEKKNVIVSRNSLSPIKTATDIEMSRVTVKSMPSDITVNNTMGTVKQNNEYLKHDENENNGIKLSLTPLKNTTEVSESNNSTSCGAHRPINISDRDNITANRIGGSYKGPPSALEGPREIDADCALREKDKTTFCFESSRELAGEPDGKADEGEITEPPALPMSPPPNIAITKPRSSFLHGGIDTVDLKTKPIVPQKPLSLFTKTGGAADVSFNVRKVSNSDHMSSSPAPPPPPSSLSSSSSSSSSLLLQNITGRSNGMQEQQTTGRSFKKNVLTEISSEIDQIPVTGGQNVEDDHPRTSKITSKSGLSLLSMSALSTTTTKNRLTDNEETDENTMPDEEEEEEEDFAEMTSVSVSTMELVRTPNKRRMAPRPPAMESTDDPLPISSLFARNPGANLKSDSPVVREKEKRERSSSCSPKFRKAVCDLPDPTIATARQTFDSIPRRIISLSQDSLTTEKETADDKKRNRNRRGFSLKRFLRMGTRKDIDMISGQTSGVKNDEIIPSTLQPKPRLEIIHPLELDGAAVEVVGGDRITKITNEDHTDFHNTRRGQNESKTTRFPPLNAGRPGKPPPPPRNQSLEDSSRSDTGAMNKPSRPPPLRAEIKLNIAARHDKTSSAKSPWRGPTNITTTADSIYANLAAEDVTGEVRSGLAPSKPQRTASIRDPAVSQLVTRKPNRTTDPNQHADYDQQHAVVRSTSGSPTISNDSHVYECLSSSPECDLNLELRHPGGRTVGDGFHAVSKRKSDSSAMETSAEMKFHHHHHHHHQFVRSTSLPYCGSETESELYAPYSFYTGDEGAEEDQDWKGRDDEPRMSRLGQRRGRSIVHRSLEDNYGAVVVANHEALTQYLEQENQTIQLPLSLRALKNTSPQLKHFNIDTTTSVSIGSRIFCSATWNDQNVTLCITFDLAVPMPQRDFYLLPIMEFVDRIPQEIIANIRTAGNNDTEATISIYPRFHVTTIQSFGAMLKDMNNEDTNREASFVLLQLVSALKSLQARGIEDATKSMTDIILCREDKDICYRLHLLQRRLNLDVNNKSGEVRVSLCECALIALQYLHLKNELPLIQELLIRERAVTLSQVKSVLEFSLWGPSDVPHVGGPREREMALQRWLDLERANVLHALVKTKTTLTVTDEYHLLFLVRTTAKIMSEASILLDEQRIRFTRKD